MSHLETLIPFSAVRADACVALKAIGCYAGLHREQFVVCTWSVARGHAGGGKGKAEVVGGDGEEPAGSILGITREVIG
jgi:hypothetical protein